MNVLALTRYDRLGASSRVRFLQYLPAVAEAGMRVSVASLFSDDYVRGLQHGRRSPRAVANAYLARLRQLRRGASGEWDLLWIEKELLPWFPPSFERSMLPKGVPFVLDYDDAVFHQYDQHPSGLVRRLLRDKHPSLIRGAAAVVVGSEYLAEYARAAGATRVELIPSAVDLEKYPAGNRAVSQGSRTPIVGWIGQQSTAENLRHLVPVFDRMTQKPLVRFTAVGIDAAALGLPMSSLPWSEETESASLCDFDIGIMPLVDAPFQRGKCGYKLIQYMAAGLPVVASPVGVNRDIVVHGLNGFLAQTEREWEEALRTLASNAELRRQFGASGRSQVERDYCISITAPRIISVLKEAAASGCR